MAPSDKDARERGRDRDKPLYMISVAAELTGMHPQTLRVYEQKGLVTPGRSRETRACTARPTSSGSTSSPSSPTRASTSRASCASSTCARGCLSARPSSTTCVPASASSRTRFTSTGCRRRSPRLPATTPPRARSRSCAGCSWAARQTRRTASSARLPTLRLFSPATAPRSRPPRPVCPACTCPRCVLKNEPMARGPSGNLRVSRRLS